MYDVDNATYEFVCVAFAGPDEVRFAVTCFSPVAMSQWYNVRLKYPSAATAIDLISTPTLISTIGAAGRDVDLRW
jgi:hypothetical protein